MARFLIFPIAVVTNLFENLVIQNTPYHLKILKIICFKKLIKYHHTYT